MTIPPRIKVGDKVKSKIIWYRAGKMGVVSGIDGGYYYVNYGTDDTSEFYFDELELELVIEDGNDILKGML